MTPQQTNSWRRQKLKEVFKLEVGTPLQKALVDNFEAQKQLKEAIYVCLNQRTKEILELVEGAKMTADDFSGDYKCDEYCEHYYKSAGCNFGLDRLTTAIRDKYIKNIENEETKEKKDKDFLDVR